MTDEIEVRLEIGMAATVDAARVEKEAWAEMRRLFACCELAPTNPIHVRIIEERYLHWQREEQLRRHALQAYKEAKDGE